MANTKHATIYTGSVPYGDLDSGYPDYVEVCTLASDVDVLMAMNTIDEPVEVRIPQLGGVPVTIVVPAGLGFALDLIANQKKIPGGVVDCRAYGGATPTRGMLTIVGLA